MSSQKRMTQKLFAKLPTAFLLGFALCGGMTITAAAAPADGAAPKDDRNIVYRTGPDGRVIATVPTNVPDSPAFARFAAWLEKYSQATAEQKPALEAEGVKLATERRKFMAEMIPRDPKHALELAIMPAQRKDLPEEVLEQLEEFLQGRGEHLLIGTVLRKNATGGDAEQTEWIQTFNRSFTYEKEQYTPHFYGTLKGLSSYKQLPFYGVAIDGQLAVHENPLRILKEGEAIPANIYRGKEGAACPICKKISTEGIIGILGDTAYSFDTEEHAQEFAAQSIELH